MTNEEVRVLELTRCWQIVKTIQADVFKEMLVPGISRIEWCALSSQHQVLSMAAKMIMDTQIAFTEPG